MGAQTGAGFPATGNPAPPPNWPLSWANTAETDLRALTPAASHHPIGDPNTESKNCREQGGEFFRATITHAKFI